MLFDFIKRFWLLNPALGFIGHVGGGASGSFATGAERSLRFRAAAGASLTRTPGTPTSTQKMTLFGASKFTGTSGSQDLFNGRVSGTSYFIVRLYRSTGTILIQSENPSIVVQLETTAVLRDPTAFYLWMLAIDTTQATAANRVRLYLVQKDFSTAEVTSFSTNTPPAQNTSFILNTGIAHAIGVLATVGSNYLDAIQAPMGFVDGAQLVPSDVFQIDSNSIPMLKTKAGIRSGVSATGLPRNGWGANGFLLPFDDASSTTTLGYDRSQSDTDTTGNNWTCNNISLTAGVTYDSMLDYPQNAASGVQPVGNYPTISPIHRNTSYTTTPTDGNLHITSASVGTQLHAFTMPIPTTGKWYLGEFTIVVPNSMQLGIVRSNDATLSSSTESYVGSSANGYGYRPTSGDKVNGTGGQQAYGPSAGATDVIAVAYDADNGKLYFAKQTGGSGSFVWMNSGDPVGGTGYAYSGLSGEFILAVSVVTAGAASEVKVNCGQQPFNNGSIPTGFKANCTANWPDTAVTTSGTFNGTLNADGPVGNLNGIPLSMTINGNAVTFGTHVDKLANGFKVRSNSASYNNTGSNTFSITAVGDKFSHNNRAQGNP
ncbi:MAG: hypothetical protein Q7U97_06705 [Rhodocyclaceae bacterium]|nr:hypothetical protein [Rhodocyclaceae bacterium]